MANKRREKPAKETINNKILLNNLISDLEKEQGKGKGRNPSLLVLP